MRDVENPPTIPYRDLVSGGLNFEEHREGQFSLNLDHYYDIMSGVLGDDFRGQLSDISLKGEPIDVMLRSLSHCIPPQLHEYNSKGKRELYDELNEAFVGHFAVARNLYLEQLAREQRGAANYPDNNLSREMQIAIAQLTEHSWYLVLLNHRYIFEQVRASSKWSKVKPEDQDALYQSVLLACWKYTCRYDPDIAIYGTFLTGFVRHLAIRIASEMQGVTQHQNHRYLNNYYHAKSILRDTVLDQSYWHELLACMLIKSKQGWLEFDDPQLALLAFERLIRNKPPLASDYRYLNLIRQKDKILESYYHNDLPMVTALVSMINTVSLDKERNLFVINTETGELKPIDSTLFRLLTDGDSVEDQVDVQLLRQVLNEIFDDILSPIQREVVSLYFGLDGNGPHSVREIAAIMSYSTGGITSSLNRAITRIKRYKRARLVPFIR